MAVPSTVAYASRCGMSEFPCRFSISLAKCYIWPGTPWYLSIMTHACMNCQSVCNCGWEAGKWNVTNVWIHQLLIFLTVAARTVGLISNFDYKKHVSNNLQSIPLVIFYFNIYCVAMYNIVKRWQKLRIIFFLYLLKSHSVFTDPFNLYSTQVFLFKKPVQLSSD